MLYPCLRSPWTRKWWEETLFAGHRIVCNEVATVDDVRDAQVLVAAFKNPRNKREGWEFKRSILQRLHLSDGHLSGKVLVHIDDEYGARRKQTDSDWSVYCSLYSGWKHVFRNYWSEAWARMVPPSSGASSWAPGRLNCTEHCPSSSLGVPPRVEWMPLGWSANWRPRGNQEPPRPTASRSHFIGFYGNEKYQLKPNRGALIARFEKETGVKVTRLLGRVGFGKGNLSHYEHMMHDTRLCLQISGLSAECYRMYESLDAGCVPVVVDQFGQEMDAQYRFFLGTRRRHQVPAPFPRALAPADLRDTLKKLGNSDELGAMQKETHAWWNHSLRHIRSRLQHVSWSWCQGGGHGLGRGHLRAQMP